MFYAKSFTITFLVSFSPPVSVSRRTYENFFLCFIYRCSKCMWPVLNMTCMCFRKKIVMTEVSKHVESCSSLKTYLHYHKATKLDRLVSYLEGHYPPLKLLDPLNTCSCKDHMKTKTYLEYHNTYGRHNTYGCQTWEGLLHTTWSFYSCSRMIL